MANLLPKFNRTKSRPKPHEEGGLHRLLRILGPGLVTGAADDDPGGIATYSQTGAQFGYGQLWTTLLMYPLMTAVQEVSARIGAVTGKGIAAIVRDRYNRWVLYLVVLLVVLANVINIGADVGAMAAATRLVIPRISFAAATIGFVVLVLLFEIFMSYKSYVKLLKWLALFLLAYPATALIVHLNWAEALKATVVPHFEFNFAFLFIITGVLGTTITPYMFFWQASEEIEEEIADHRLAQKGGEPKISKPWMKRLRLDTILGMLASEVTTWFIIVTCAATLHAHGVTNIQTAADAARALEPLAGTSSKLLFALGIIGLGFLAVPVLAGSASYALSEALGWREGLYRKYAKARGFYLIIILATVAGLGINFVGVDPVKALIFSAVFNGVAAVPLIFLIMRIGRDREVMGDWRSGWLSHSLVVITFIAMAVAAVAMFFALGH